MTPNVGSGSPLLELWRILVYHYCITTVTFASHWRCWPSKVCSTHHWSLCGRTALEWGASYRITTPTCKYDDWMTYHH